MAVRFCNHCQEPFQKGHILYDEYYYCSESCLRLDNASDKELQGKTMEEMYEEDIQFYTDWSEVEPYYTVVPVFETFDTFFFKKEIAQRIADEHLAAKEKVKSRYVLLTQEEYELLDEETGHSSSEYKIFDKLLDARNAYEEIE